jgi:hypothetical protein
VKASAQNSALPKSASSPRAVAAVAGRRPHAGDERFGRIVGDEALRELARDEARRRRMRGEVSSSRWTSPWPPPLAIDSPKTCFEPSRGYAAVLVVAARPDVVDPVPVRQREASITSACV